jgi:hypothetical protein
LKGVLDLRMRCETAERFCIWMHERMNEQTLSEAWTAGGLRYAQALNQYIARGRRTGWKSAGPEPSDDRTELAPRVLEAVRNANLNGTYRRCGTGPPYRSERMDVSTCGTNSQTVVTLPRSRMRTS